MNTETIPIVGTGPELTLAEALIIIDRWYENHHSLLAFNPIKHKLLIDGIHSRVRHFNVIAD